MDAVVLLDGGSDSLMRGDEHGVGDLTEDAVGNDTIPAAALDDDNDGIDNVDMLAAASTMHHTCALHRCAHPCAGQRRSSFSAEFRHPQGSAFPNISQAFP